MSERYRSGSELAGISDQLKDKQPYVFGEADLAQARAALDQPGPSFSMVVVGVVCFLVLVFPAWWGLLSRVHGFS